VVAEGRIETADLRVMKTPINNTINYLDDFPTPLANPANNAGFALYHRLYGYWLIYQTGHFTCLENRTFPLAKVTAGLPTTHPELAILIRIGPG
jgi:hypothetical protein